jgi:NAD(P)-dependent dehydrogenase (short-subunit alcohol dehydrogenase family)
MSPSGPGGRVAIVTGASSGIGRATCVALARTGAQIVAVGRDERRLAATAALLREAGCESPLVLALDVRCEADMQRMSARTMERFGRIDALVHAAGIPRAPRRRCLRRLAAEEWDGGRRQSARHVLATARCWRCSHSSGDSSASSRWVGAGSRSTRRTVHRSSALSA